ncbi:hypothetical protein NDR87_18650 [Nocardia sp. CDC159]|uniref:Uncharacterized protein n=1 Tax=Nocardia pulmonis TaxID=2951408 RepID=A0A9X2E8D9_9NOCA|nr:MULTISPECIES: hypothetical protein [Nocardia]MCM6775639.1 hypothetical protein [Nocardia pulmonis]MCM6788385.1 hypothetical protein [Nocardia sp. CDC159]
MNGIINIASIGVAASAISHVPASRGVLALQGTGLSAVSIFGTEHTGPKHAHLTDKPMRSWQPIYAQAFFGANAAVVRPTADLQAARLRDENPATVIRSRHRLR